jgi:hypothetical protein
MSGALVQLIRQKNAAKRNLGSAIQRNTIDWHETGAFSVLYPQIKSHHELPGSGFSKTAVSDSFR